MPTCVFLPVYCSLAVSHPYEESAVTIRRSFCGLFLSSLYSQLLHLSLWLMFPFIRAGLVGAIGYPSTSGRFFFFFKSLHSSLPHHLLDILLCGWEYTESCFSRVLGLTCTGFEWQNWVQRSAEEGSVLLLLFGFNILKGFPCCRAEGQSLPSSLLQVLCAISTYLYRHCHAGSAF